MQGTCFNCSRKPVVVSSYLNYSHEVLAGHSVQARPVGSLRRRLAPSFPGQQCRPEEAQSVHSGREPSGDQGRLDGGRGIWPERD